MSTKLLCLSLVWCWVLSDISSPSASPSSSQTSRSMKWPRLPALRPCSLKHSFAGQDMSPGWKTIASHKSYYMEICPLAIVTEGHLEKDAKILWKGPSPLATWITISRQDKQPIAWTGEAQSTRPPLPMKPHGRRANMEDKRRRRKKTEPFWNHHWTDHDNRQIFPHEQLWKDLPISDRFHQPSACLLQTRTSSFMNLRSRSSHDDIIYWVIF